MRIEMRALQLLPALVALAGAPAWGEVDERFVLRGKTQTLRIYGPAEGPPVLVSSGDGGWIHLGPVVAEFLAASGYSVVGVDCKAYLSSFTSGSKTLAPEDVQADYRTLVERARRGRDAKVILVGVSLGAGLSVLAAAGTELQPALSGVLGLGLPDRNELGWRFRDSIIYITKKVPNEPTFRATDYIPKLGALPLAAIHSTHDEFVPLDEARALLALPGGPRKLWVVEAADHRFSNNAAEMQRRLLEALEWIKGGGG